MREKLFDYSVSARYYGITPACAGKTKADQFANIVGRDHSRVCGKNLAISSTLPARPGSLPRVREKPALRGSARTCFGITPACAGKTVRRSLPRLKVQDHSRVCGKNNVTILEFGFTPGSLPRVREKLDKNLWVVMYSRITPACAGKTLLLQKKMEKLTDHSRECGN